MDGTMSQIFGNGFIPNDGLSATTAPWAGPNDGVTGSFPPGSPGFIGYRAASPDAVRRAWFGGSTLPGGAPNPYAGSGIGAILAQLATQVGQTIAKLSSALLGSPSPTATFQNVALASTGDPHLSVSGTEQNPDGSSTVVNSAFDSMTAHHNLFSTDDFGDGFRVSTKVTQATSNGVTQNAAATATMDGGRESVTLTNAGAVSVTDDGRSLALAPGQSLTLSGGQQVSAAANGAVSISESAFGASLTTTFAHIGGGVDVTARGENVTLGGDLIGGGTAPIARRVAL